MNKITSFFAIVLISTFGWAQEGIQFNYEFKKDKSISNLVNVTAQIINNSKTDIYFLSESCNGLEYYLATNSNSVEIVILNHCNATFPQKIEVKKNSTYKFTTIIEVKEPIEKFGLILKLVKLLKTSKVEGKSIDKIKKENTESILTLEGPNIKIE